MLRHFFALMRRRPFSSEKMEWRVCFWWAGSLRVSQAVSMIQPRMSFRVLQLPSPVNSFLRDTASFVPLVIGFRLGEHCVDTV
jgi:hypothetical protein